MDLPVFFDAKAQQRGFRSLFVPASDAPEAVLVEGSAVYPVASLAELVQRLNDRQPIARYENQLRFDGDAASAAGGPGGHHQPGHRLTDFSGQLHLHDTIAIGPRWQSR